MTEGKFGGPRPFASSEGSLWLGAITGADADRMALEQRLTEIVPDTSLSDIAKDPVTDESVITVDIDEAPGGDLDELFDEASQEEIRDKREDMMEAVRTAAGDVVLAAELPRKRGGHTFVTLEGLIQQVIEPESVTGPVQPFIMAGPAVKNDEDKTVLDELPRPFTDSEFKFYTATIMYSVEAAKELERVLISIEDTRQQSDSPVSFPRSEVVRENEVVFREAFGTDMLMDKLSEEANQIEVITGISELNPRFHNDNFVEIVKSTSLNEDDVEKIGFVSRSD